MKQRLTLLALVLTTYITTPLAMAGDLTAKEKRMLSRAYRQDRNGWIFLHIEGKPFELGFQRGYLTAREIAEAYETIALFVKFETGKDADFFIKAAGRLFKNKVSSEYVQEMKGIAAGVARAGFKADYDTILFLNGLYDLIWYWWPEQKDKEPGKGPGCSAFIATGDATVDGGIVMGHNTWTDYAPGSYCNIVVELVPHKGHRILMQACDASIYSSTDFFITGAGLVGTETTISKFDGYDKRGKPVFERARKAMQYADSIDTWAGIMIKNNNGAYANSWLLGDIRTNEIARLELGLKHHSLEKKKNGHFTGSNIAENIEIIRDETSMSWDTPLDIRHFTVARKVRWRQLMKKYQGKIDIEIGKKMLADHYDVYLQKEQPGQRTICAHWELDDGSVPGSYAPFLPLGAFDGKVVDSKMAREWQILAKWGGSCDIPFKADEFLDKHPQFEWMRGHLKDMPPQPWTIFPVKKGP